MTRINFHITNVELECVQLHKIFILNNEKSIHIQLK